MLARERSLFLISRAHTYKRKASDDGCSNKTRAAHVIFDRIGSTWVTFKYFGSIYSFQFALVCMPLFLHRFTRFPRNVGSFQFDAASKIISNSNSDTCVHRTDEFSRNSKDFQMLSFLRFFIITFDSMLVHPIDFICLPNPRVFAKLNKLMEHFRRYSFALIIYI